MAKYPIYEGSTVYWELNENILTLSGYGSISNSSDNWAQNEAPWYNQRDSIKKIILRKKIGNSDTGLIKIGQNAFYDCDNLEAIFIPIEITEIGSDALSGCEKLENVFYEGTRTQWGQVTGNGNIPINKLIFNYEGVHKILHSRMKQKSDTYTNWAKATNFVPFDGEIIVFTPDDNQDTRGTRIKIGDGNTNVNELPFVTRDADAIVGTYGTGIKAEIFNNENNIASGDYSHAEGTSSIKPFNYIDYKPEEPYESYVRPYGTINTWVDNEGISLINKFNYKNKTFELPSTSIAIYPSTTAQEDVGANSFKALDFPNHRFMLGDGYNKEIKEAKNSNYTNWIYVFADENNPDQVYLRAEDNINGSQTITWNLSAPIEAPYVFIDQFNEAVGDESHIEGAGNLALGDRSHIEGRHNEIKISSNNSHIEGFGNIVNSGNSAHIEGERNLTIGTNAGIHIEGRANVAQGGYSHVEGRNNFALGAYSHVGGYGTRYPFTVNETIEKTTTSATNTSSIIIDLPVDEANVGVSMPAPDIATNVLHWGIWYINKTKAIARRIGTMYKENNKLKFTIRTVAAETITIDPTDDTYFYWGNVANGTGTFVMGKESYAYGNYSTAIGQGAVAKGIGQIALGKYNNIDDTSLLIIGKGTDVLNRSNALTLNSTGDLNIAGNLITNGTTIQIVSALPSSPDPNTLYIVTG